MEALPETLIPFWLERFLVREALTFPSEATSFEAGLLCRDEPIVIAIEISPEV